MAKKQSHRYKLVMILFAVVMVAIAALGLIDMRPTSGESTVALAVDVLDK
jgi:hypothetical protein